MYARRLIYAGALVAIAGLSDPAMAQTPSEDFKFNYDSAYGQKRPIAALRRPQHHRTELRHRRGDQRERPQPEGLHIGAGQPRHCCWGAAGSLRGKQPLDTGQLPPYLGPYYNVRRTVGGAIDTTFGLAATSASSRPAQTPPTHSPVCASIPAPATSSSSGRK